jgi:hypothetical protein
MSAATIPAARFRAAAMVWLQQSLFHHAYTAWVTWEKFATLKMAILTFLGQAINSDNGGVGDGAGKEGL